jgi:malonate decarboxylase delta subunit
MSTPPPGLETLDFEFPGSKLVGSFSPILVGVVGSGNLEVLFEPAPQPACRFRVQTSARGFGTIWEAVLRDFHERHDFAGLQVSINDMGATPAVVSLRLSQAAAEMPGATP